MKKRYGSGLTPKERRQAEEYHKFMKERNPQRQQEDLFGSATQAPEKGGIERNCSVCGSKQAWRSSDHGMTWQCWEHAKEL